MKSSSTQENSSHNATHQHLLETGVSVMAQFGFSGVGLSAILKQAGVPKGSFYHYFASKEQFGQAVLDHYFACYIADVNRLLTDKAVSPIVRVHNYFSCWQAQYCSLDPVQTCLVVKLSAEVADLSEPMRLALRDGTDQLISCLASTLAQDSDVFDEKTALTTATTLYQLWLGASLLTKLHRNDSHLAQAMTITEEKLGLID
ncbi:TetR/AcrR family transcriptional regulator [Salinivibrio kushneri]|uniref:TetR/AcrR family transcriptional regulator n=1 Tax=Salinivibrio kushneri TaxID=1908198 RepID=UPI0022B3FD3C|nr:TetR/AcrR family transcriptional regulator [Salinivibrio kushneri]WBA19320.1 TetR/AcrR family transcriptional regulator [Salinivibrio kushneri]